MNKFKYIYFDVSGTLLYKPTLFKSIIQVLEANGYEIPLKDIKLKHKLLSEVIHFPDSTNEEFYQKFNSELLYSLGIIPEDYLLKQIFKKCSYLPWEKYEDVDVLNELNLPMGIISNFNSSLRDKMKVSFGNIFSDFLVSEEIGIAKPNVDFYKRAIDKIQLDPEQILYIGDSIKLDVEPALKVGMNPLLIDRDGLYPSSKFNISSLKSLKKYINL